MSPIEHLWDPLGRRIRQRQQPPVTVQDLGRALQDEWRQIPIHVIRRLTNSMRRRVVSLVASRGGHTRY